MSGCSATDMRGEINVYVSYGDTWVLQVRGADRFLQFEAQQVESEAGWAALQGGDEKVQDVDSCFMTDSG